MTDMKTNFCTSEKKMTHDNIGHMQQPNTCTSYMTIFHSEKERRILIVNAGTYLTQASLNTKNFATKV